MRVTKEFYKRMDTHAKANYLEDVVLDEIELTSEEDDDNED